MREIREAIVLSDHLSPAFFHRIHHSKICKKREKRTDDSRHLIHVSFYFSLFAPWKWTENREKKRELIGKKGTKKYCFFAVFTSFFGVFLGEKRRFFRVIVCDSGIGKTGSRFWWRFSGAWACFLIAWRKFDGAFLVLWGEFYVERDFFKNFRDLK